MIFLHQYVNSNKYPGLKSTFALGAPGLNRRLGLVPPNLPQTRLNGNDSTATELSKTRSNAEQCAGSLASLENKLGVNENRLGQCEAMNRKLYELSNALLDRYRQKGILDVLNENEPLTGLGKVNTETLEQDYHNRLSEQLIRTQAR
jgi:hypothetical protein